MKKGIFLAIPAAALSLLLLREVPPASYYFALAVMLAGACLCSSDGPIFPKKATKAR